MERSHRFPARFYARFLESLYGRSASDVLVRVVEVGVQRGRFAHTMLSTLWHSPVCELRSKKARKRHAISESFCTQQEPWPGGPGSLRGRVEYTTVDFWQKQGQDYNESGNAASHTQVTNLRSAIDLLAPFWPAVSCWFVSTLFDIKLDWFSHDQQTLPSIQ